MAVPTVALFLLSLRAINIFTHIAPPRFNLSPPPTTPSPFKCLLLLIPSPQYSRLQRNDKLMAYLTPIVNILSTFSDTLGEGIGLVFSPVKTISIGIGVFHRVATDIMASYEKLVYLFERMHFFLQRLQRYTGISLPPDMIDLLGKIMAQVLSVLAYSTHAMKQCRAREFFRRLVGRTDVENGLQRNLEITHRVDVNVKANMEFNHHVVHKVTALEGVVDDVLSNANMIREGVRNVNDNVTSMKHAMNGAQRNQLREKLMAWLAPPDPSINHNTACGTQHEGTASWFLESDTFDEWKQNDSVLWIRGNPGSRKTVLCSSASQILTGMFYISFSKLVTMGRNSPASVRSQIAFKARSKLPIFVILDTLDECPNPGDSSPREKVLYFLEDLLGLNDLNLHICITSRPDWGAWTAGQNSRHCAYAISRQSRDSAD
ncbi:hypothetical protein BC826DRAFT_1178858 [Russula brevipes]|nr:hypothetical protein BC826DRAFT_1178858 [Russula brevipes]